METQTSLQFGSLDAQTDEFVRIIYLNPNLRELLNTLKFPYELPWYLGAGCLNQTVWNHLTDRPITHGIGDYDLVYWDTDLSKEKEQQVQSEVSNMFSHLNIELEVINEARVHTWFEQDYGVKIQPYVSLEHAISTWPATATCIAVTKRNGLIKVCAPYGLNDVFGMVIKPNMPHVILHVFEKKVAKWTQKWPELKVANSLTL
jgi:hypothetical protein